MTIPFIDDKNKFIRDYHIIIHFGLWDSYTMELRLIGMSHYCE